MIIRSLRGLVFVLCALVIGVSIHLSDTLNRKKDFHGDENAALLRLVPKHTIPHWNVFAGESNSLERAAQAHASEKTKMKEAGSSTDSYSFPSTTPQKASKTIALLDPRFTGGFRNQHMRLTGLVTYAIQQKIPNILLDSLRYDNKVVSRATNSSLVGRIPFQDLFDVEHWNRISDRVGTHVLPRLVPYSSAQHPDWDPDRALFRGIADTVVTGFAESGPRFRQADLYPKVENCTQPYAFGSGRKVGQRSWGAYMEHKKQHGNQLSDTDWALVEALQPSQSLANAVASITYHSQHEPDSITGQLLAIHPRTELDMLQHKCSKFMTKNLTKIFEMIQESSFFSKPDGTNNYQQVYLCISRSGMEEKTGAAYQRFQGLMDHNLRTLNQAAHMGLWNGKVRVREGGEPFATSLGIPWDMVHTAAQVLDFFVAVRAKTFVGTFGSSYSTDVWTARYVLAKKKGGHDRESDPLNYFHGPNGIGLIGNGGLPPAHHCS